MATVPETRPLILGICTMSEPRDQLQIRDYRPDDFPRLHHIDFICFPQELVLHLHVPNHTSELIGSILGLALLVAAPSAEGLDGQLE